METLIGILVGLGIGLVACYAIYRYGGTWKRARSRSLLGVVRPPRKDDRG